MSLVGSLFGFQAERCWYIPFVWAPYNLRKRRCLSVHVGGSSVTVLSWGSFALSRYFVRRRWDDSTQSGAGVSFPIFSACFWFLCTRIYTSVGSSVLPLISTRLATFTFEGSEYPRKGIHATYSLTKSPNPLLALYLSLHVV
jgi:hypothetical protein